MFTGTRHVFEILVSVQRSGAVSIRMPRCGSLVWLGLAAVAGIMGLRKLHRALAQLDPPPTCPCSRVLHGGCYGGGSCSAGGPPLGDDVEVVIAHCKHSLDFLGDLRGDIVSAGLHLK